LGKIPSNLLGLKEGNDGFIIHDIYLKVFTINSGGLEFCKTLDIIEKHGDLKAHFRALAQQCERAIALMVEFSDAGIF
jgi:hypothetical protein